MSVDACGTARKMHTALGSDEVLYQLPLGDERIDVNDLIGRTVRIAHTGSIHCVLCGRRTKKSYGQGSCYPCFRDAPQNAECIVRPELCRAHLGEGRDVEWERAHHDQPHVVYLAVSSGLKVGVTRATQVPTRWIDQGARQAIVLARTPYRQLAGAIEVVLKEHYADRTNWRRMLAGDPPDIDLRAARDEAADRLDGELRAHLAHDDDILTIPYPVTEVVGSVKSINLEKTPEVEEVLTGIKGQYLLFGDGRVLNVRRHQGFDLLVQA